MIVLFISRDQSSRVGGLEGGCSTGVRKKGKGLAVEIRSVCL